MSKKINGTPPPNPYGGGLGSLGQPGVRETKVVGETSEIKIPRKQFMETWIFSFLILILAYASLKLLITDRGDWSLFIGILTIIFVPAAYLFFERKIAYKFFPRVWEDVMTFLYRCVHTDDAGRFILFAFVVSIILLVSVGFYIYIIVPQLTLILDQQAQFVFVFGATISLIFAFIPYFKFNKRQLEDSLRDSDSHYATRALEIEEERRIRREEAMQQLLDAPVSQEKNAAWYEPVQFNRATETPTEPRNERQKLFKQMTIDFLNGISAGYWTTSERSWRDDENGKKILDKSKVPLMSKGVGQSIRDALIRGGWARWKNPNDEQKGWELLYTPEEIIDGAFRYGSNAIVANSGASGDFYGEDVIDGD
jgi:hypothetical protein